MLAHCFASETLGGRADPLLIALPADSALILLPDLIRNHVIDCGFV